LAQAADNLSAESRAKIAYLGVDGRRDYAEFCMSKAQGLGLGEVRCECAMLEAIGTLWSGRRFDLVTCLNTVHELRARDLPTLLFEGISRLAQDGLFCAYDMQALEGDKLELGATTWTHGEMQEVLGSVLGAIGVSQYAPHVARWRHSRVDGWSFELQRDAMGLADHVVASRKSAAESAGRAKLLEILRRKERVCRLILDGLVEGEIRSENEQETKLRALYDYYALRRAYEGLTS
jgi:hypothetical protein